MESKIVLNNEEEYKAQSLLCFHNSCKIPENEAVRLTVERTSLTIERVNEIVDLMKEEGYCS